MSIQTGEPTKNGILTEDQITNRCSSIGNVLIRTKYMDFAREGENVGQTNGDLVDCLTLLRAQFDIGWRFQWQTSFGRSCLRYDRSLARDCRLSMVWLAKETGKMSEDGKTFDLTIVDLERFEKQIIQTNQSQSVFHFETEGKGFDEIG